MRLWGTVALASVLLFFQPDHVSGQTKVGKVFLLENETNNKWCAYNNETTWSAAVQEDKARTVGMLTYANDHLLQIDVTETDESGDWTVYDHYFLSDRGQIVKLSRMLNVLPGDRSVLQTFSISQGKARKISTTEKQLSTGKVLTSAQSVWLPDLPIQTGTKLFPFSGLLGLPNLTTSSTSCVERPASAK